MVFIHSYGIYFEASGQEAHIKQQQQRNEATSSHQHNLLGHFGSASAILIKLINMAGGFFFIRTELITINRGVKSHSLNEKHVNNSATDCRCPLQMMQ